MERVGFCLDLFVFALGNGVPAKEGLLGGKERVENLQ
jgi:hypothetical protein